MPTCRAVLPVATLILGLLLLGFPPATGEWGRERSSAQRAGPGAPGAGHTCSLSGGLEKWGFLGWKWGRLMRTKIWGPLVPKGGDPWNLGCEVLSAGDREATED